MSIELRTIEDVKQIYDYTEKLAFPYKYQTDYMLWEKSYLHDIDGGGKTMFSDLRTMGAFFDGELVGYIQYGRTAFGFDNNGEITDNVSYQVIRNFFFQKGHMEAGTKLLNEAINAFSGDRIYAFFHYFGMSCYARHGKLHEKFGHIHELLNDNGFCIEHENVFYSSVLGEKKTAANDGIILEWHNDTSGGQRYCDFILDNAVIGGCEVHFLEQKNIAYLRWIFINEDLCGKGLGTRCMDALKSALFIEGITHFDTDTALTNKVAQRFYVKNGFTDSGLTRSYYRSGTLKGEKQ